MKSRLEQAAQHVRRGQETIEALKRRVAAIKAAGGDPATGETLLRHCERSQEICEAVWAELEVAETAH
jgi:hypothetical protein